MWSKKDSENLDSIAKSLAKLADREQERNLYPELTLSETNQPFLQRMKKHLREKREEIKVHEGPALEDAAMEEDIKIVQRMQNKVAQADRDGNMPFFAEALLEEEELELL